MRTETIFTPLPFTRCSDGSLFAGAASFSASAEAASIEADLLMTGCAGAIAYCRIVDVHTGESSGAKVIKRVGDVPDLCLG